MPDKIVYDGQAAGVTTYHNQLLAIEDRNALFHEVKLKDLGFAGDYFLEFEASDSYSMCYGSWEIIGSVEGKEEI